MEEMIGAQTMFPDASVVRALVPEHDVRVETVRPPVVMESPPPNVEVAVVVPMKYPAVAELPSTDAPSTESLAYGVVVPIPRLPAKLDDAVEVEVKVPTERLFVLPWSQKFEEVVEN